MKPPPPLYPTIEDIQGAQDEQGLISGEIEVTLDELIDTDHSDIQALATERMVGEEQEHLLCNVKFKIVGHTEQTLKLHATADPSILLKRAGVTKPKKDNDKKTA